MHTFEIPAEMISKIRETAGIMESEGRLTDEILAYLYEERLFKLFVPIALGGRMTDLPAAVRIFEQAAEVDGSFGWLLTIGSGGGFFSATLPEAVAERLFSVREAVVAGSGHPTGNARAVPGGYLVSGQWKYCSGSSYASVFTANALVARSEAGAMERPKEEQEIRSFAFLPEQVEILQDWRAMGLKATESHTIRVRETFVPEEMTFDILTEPRYEDPVFRYPFLPFAQVSFAAVVIGCGNRFVQEASELAEGKRSEWEAAGRGRYAAVTGAIAAQRIRFTEAREAFYHALDASWAVFKQNGVLKDEAQREIDERSREAARAAAEMSHTLLPLLGMTALMEDQPVNRAWRDLHTAAQHGVLNAAE